MRKVGEYLVVDVTIDELSPVPLLLDTGAYHSSIDSELARTLSATDLGPAVVVGWAGEIPTRIVRARTLDAGPLHVSGPVFTVIDRFVGKAVKSDMARAGVRGILGTEMLERFVLSVDYGTPEVKLTHAAGALPPGEPPFRMRAEGDGRYSASLAFGGRSAWLLVDTGANDTVTLSEDLARSMALDPERGPAVQGIALGGTVESRQVGVADVRIAGRSVQLPLYTSRDLAGLDGRIGSGLLKFWTWVFDFPNETMWAQ